MLCWMLVVELATASAANIKVQVSKEANEWVVDYQLPHAVNQVFFYREGSLPRDGWLLSDKDLTLKTAIDQPHSIHAKQGQLFEQFSLRFASDYRTTPKDYELNFAFTDGGELLYTGHLLLALKQAEKTDHTFDFKPQDNSQIILNGQVHEQTHQWSDPDWSGTYVYFGGAKPVSSEHMLAVIDPGLPEWIGQRMAVDLPKLFAFYTEQTGLALNFKPMVFFSFAADERPGTQYSGGVLPGLIQLQVKGKDWQQNTPDNLIGVSHFLAHEAAHLWNSQLIKSDDDRDASWIHEGGADAFAVRALAHLGVLTDEAVLLEHEKYLNRCIDALQTHAVTAFEQHRNFQVFYHCGATIALMTEQVVRRKNPQADLFDFWAAMMQRVSEADLKLTTAQYFKSLSLGGYEELFPALITLLEEPQQQPNVFFSQVLQAVGLTATEVEKHPQLASKATQSVLRHLMLLDCNSYSYNNHGSYYVVGQHLQCQQLKPGMQISQIMGLPTSDGHTIHARVREQCALGGSVDLVTELKTVSLSCHKPLAKLRHWLSLTEPSS